MHKIINGKDVYMDCDTTADIKEDTVKQYGDLTGLKQLGKILKEKIS